MKGELLWIDEMEWPDKIFCSVTSNGYVVRLYCFRRTSVELPAFNKWKLSRDPVRLRHVVTACFPSAEPTDNRPRGEGRIGPDSFENSSQIGLYDRNFSELISEGKAAVPI